MPAINRSPRVVRATRRTSADRDQHLAHHGWFYSWKRNANIAYRGLLAFDFLSLAEAHPMVVRTLDESESIDWWEGSTWSRHVPQYTLVTKTARRGVERKIDIDVLWSDQRREHQMREARLRRECSAVSRLYIVLTEKQLRVEPRRTNVKFILSQAGQGIVTEEEKNLVRQIAIGTQHFSLNEVVGLGVLSYARAYTATLNMVATGELQFSLGRRFDGETRIWRRWR